MRGCVHLWQVQTSLSTIQTRLNQIEVTNMGENEEQDEKKEEGDVQSRVHKGELRGVFMHVYLHVHVFSGDVARQNCFNFKRVYSVEKTGQR